jgi:hypothetical protein
MKTRNSCTPKFVTAIVLLIWLTISRLLGTSIIASISFGIEAWLCLLVGYAVLSLWRLEWRPLIAILAAILGIEIVTSVYAVARFYGSPSLHLLLITVGAVLGGYRLVQACRHPETSHRSTAEMMFENYALWSGLIVMVTVGSAFYFSGRPTGGGLVFYGPMARDHIFHLALIGRLEYMLPPDNFVVAGFPFPGYHFFGDAALALFNWGFWQSGSIFDIYYRLYPGLLLFGIGFLAFWLPAKLCASRIAGAVGAAIILFGADFSWMLGLLQTVKALPNLDLAKQKLFEPWTFLSGFSTLYPLIHRPAYYHGLLMFLAGLSCVAGRAGNSTISWVVAGLFWGLMSGFNYTLATITGAAIVCGAGFYIFSEDCGRARQLLYCAGILAVASVPANIFVLLLKSVADYKATSLFTFAPGELPNAIFGGLFGTQQSRLGVLFLSTIVFIFVSYGLKLCGVWPMLNGAGFRFRSNRPAMIIILSAFAISFALGLLVKNENYGGASNNIILFQPTSWMMGLFAVYPLFVWIKNGRNRVRTAILACLLFIGTLQALPLFNFGYRLIISEEFLSTMLRIRSTASVMDVVAFLPDSVQAQGILGVPPSVSNFYITALTGLRAFYTTRAYTEIFSGQNSSETYDNRTRIIKNLMIGKVNNHDVELLTQQGVRWVILPTRIEFISLKNVSVWLSSTHFTVLRLDAPDDGLIDKSPSGIHGEGGGEPPEHDADRFPHRALPSAK